MFLAVWVPPRGCPSRLAGSATSSYCPGPPGIPVREFLGSPGNLTASNLTAGNYWEFPENSIIFNFYPCLPITRNLLRLCSTLFNKHYI